jgi:putative membrane protein
VAFFRHRVTIFPQLPNIQPETTTVRHRWSGHMLKRIAVLLLVLIIFAIMMVFTKLNPGRVELDLAFGTVESSLSLAITMTFVFGWLFGLLCTSIFAARLINERRRLRKSLRVSESEVHTLRNLPIVDAD